MRSAAWMTPTVSVASVMVAAMSAMVATPSVAAMIVAPAVVMAVSVVARAAVVVREFQAERHGWIGVGRAAVGIGAVIGVGRIVGVTVSGRLCAIIGRIRRSVGNAASETACH